MRNLLSPLARVRQHLSKPLSVCAAALLSLTPLYAQEEIVEDPFQPTVAATNSATASLTVQFTVPVGHHLYRDQLVFSVAGKVIETTLPPGKELKDRKTGKLREAYESNLTITLPLAASASATTLSIDYQGCNEEACFFPQTREYRISADGILALNGAVDAEAAEATTSPAKFLTGFEVSRRASGFMSAEKMVGFLEGKDAGQSAISTSVAKFTGWGRLFIIGGILLGGLALNLTPCVLPMIPINLAIMGAGSNRASRRRGFLLGGTYGLAMTLVYGVLGLAVVLTGAKFGSLNS